jgi:hypothetical protein
MFIASEHSASGRLGGASVRSGRSVVAGFAITIAWIASGCGSVTTKIESDASDVGREDAADAADGRDVASDVSVDSVDVADSSDGGDVADASDHFAVTDTVDVADASDVIDASDAVDAMDAMDASDASDPMLTAPRPIAPLSTSTVTSRRPTLRWALASGTDGARVEICRERACTHVVATLDVTGTSAAPTTDLSPGVVFWRLRGRSGSSTGTASSPTWQFSVGARSAAVDTSWGTTLDVNGDGFADVAVGAILASRAYVYLGSAAGIPSTPTTTLVGVDSGLFGAPVASAGDVDGDGFGDLIVGDATYAGRIGRAFVFHGSAFGLAGAPRTTIVGTDGTDAQFGSSVASAGDVNGDGYADIIVGTAITGASTSPGTARVYLGGPSGISTTPATSYVGPDGAGGNFGASVASAGDVNGDGFADIVVGAPDARGELGRAYVYLGSATGLGTSAANTYSGTTSGNDLGYSVAGAGDVNGDGYADLAVGTGGGTGRTYVYFGSATGLGATAFTVLADPDMGSGFGGPLSGAGDVNGDGFADLLVGGPWYGSYGGRAYVFLGSATGLAASPAARFTGPDGAGARFGSSVAGAGDVNGDGLADVVVGAGSANSWTGAAYVYLGSATTLSTIPATSLVGPAGMGGSFGDSVAQGTSPITSLRHCARVDHRRPRRRARTHCRVARKDPIDRARIAPPSRR